LVAIAATSPPTRAEEPMTRTQADTIIEELRQIRKLLEHCLRRSPPGSPPRGGPTSA